jgi:hypothetical protein
MADASAADDQLRTLVERVLDVLLDLLDGTRVDHRSDLGVGPRRRSDLQRLDPRGQLLDERVVHRMVHVDPVRTDAGLAAVAELRDHQAFDRGIEVGVLEDDERRVAAELE